MIHVTLGHRMAQERRCEEIVLFMIKHQMLINMSITAVVSTTRTLYDHEITMSMYKNTYSMKMLIKDAKNVYY